jgi:hypothetical protein
MFKNKSLICFLIFTFSNTIYAQYSLGLSHELGVFAGPVEFRSDYGQRNNSETNFGNMGYGIALVHFLNFSYVGYGTYIKDNYFREHFKLRSEISYNKTNFKHYGEYVNSGSNTLGKQQLQAMFGSTSLINLGTEIQFFPLKEIHDFENTDNSFNPYISLGVQYSRYSSVASSTLGALGTAGTTIQKYLEPSDGHGFGFANESKGVLSIVSSVGTRYKLNPMNDLVLDLRFQYFNSDWVDGLNPKKEIYTENQSNDWLVWLQFGYVHYLQ